MTRRSKSSIPNSVKKQFFENKQPLDYEESVKVKESQTIKFDENFVSMRYAPRERVEYLKPSHEIIRETNESKKFSVRWIKTGILARVNFPKVYNPKTNTTTFIDHWVDPKYDGKIGLIYSVNNMNKVYSKFPVVEILIGNKKLSFQANYLEPVDSSLEE